MEPQMIIMSKPTTGVARFLCLDVTCDYALRCVVGVGCDREGDNCFASGVNILDDTHEFPPIRVLIKPGVDPKVAARLLRKAADWVEGSDSTRTWPAQGSPELTADSRSSGIVG